MIEHEFDLQTSAAVNFSPQPEPDYYNHFRDEARYAHIIAGKQKRIEELEEQAIIDDMTGLHTGAALKDHLASEIAHAKRYGHAVAVIHCDIDGLKRVNDIEGHHRGDELIIGVASALAGSVRESDVVGRLGHAADEFAIAMPLANGENEDKDTFLDERTFMIRSVVQDVIALGGFNPQLHVGISLGIAVVDFAEDSRTTSTENIVAELLSTAERNMSANKKARYQYIQQGLKNNGQSLPQDERLLDQ